ncbi:MAG: T9SS C-terminal target domain-containing protein, partial [Calditrichaeota bacterium]
WQDIYLANDKRNGNSLFRNNGDGTFTDVSAVSGAGLAMDAMGLAVGDYDNNGYVDIYISNGEEGNALLRNNGDGTFTNVAEALGVAVHRICWGANFLDYDNDGDLDLYVSVSGGTPDRENPLFRNNGDGTFTRVTNAMQGGDNFQSFGNAVGDFNNDGYCDIAVLNEVDPFVLWENQGGSGNNWIKISLQGTVSNRDGIGAAIMIHTAGGQRFFRSVHCGQSYLSQNSPVHTIGVGTDSTVDVAVYWPGGAVDVLRNVPVNQHITVVETTHRMNNVAPFVGIDHTYEHRVPESLGGGAAFCDYDNDGWEDLILATGLNEPVALYRNEGRFFRYVTSSSGITDTGENKSLIWGDFDNDGWPDLFIANFEQSNRLYRNLHNGRFADYTAQAGLPADTLQSTAAAWVDYDNDGWLDLYVANYGNAHGHGDEPNRLYRNNGDGTFSDVTAQAGLAGEPNTKPLALAFFDYDNDGWPDLYICMDKGQRSSLYHNNGDGTFSDVTAASGTGAHIDAMGIAVADYDRDGFLDFYITNGPPGNRFYRNNGDGTFTEMAVQAGIAVNRECWGTAFADFDNDGIADLFVAVAAGANREDALFRGDGVAFTDISHQVGIMDASMGYGFAVADVDNDGGLDMVVVNHQFAGGDRTFLYKNSLDRGNWLKVKTVGTTSNVSGIGARVRVVVAGQAQIQEVSGGSSYLSQHSQTLHFGLGTAPVADSVIVRWPSGVVDVLTHVSANQRLVVTEGSTVGIGRAPSLPEGFFLSQNYPNPFNPVTSVKFGIGNTEWVRLKIYDLLGREVKTLVNRRLAAGHYTVQWDGTDNAGRPVASGIYLYRLTAGQPSPTTPGQAGRLIEQTRKMVLLR